MISRKNLKNIRCKDCDNRWKTRKQLRENHYPYHAKWNRRCPNCGSSDLEKLKAQQSYEYELLDYLKFLTSGKSKPAKRNREILGIPYREGDPGPLAYLSPFHPRSQRTPKTPKPLKRAAVEPEPQIEEKIPTLDLGPKHPECFGDRNIYANIQRCFDCEFTDQCRNKIREMKK